MGMSEVYQIEDKLYKMLDRMQRENCALKKEKEALEKELSTSNQMFNETYMELEETCKQLTEHKKLKEVFQEKLCKAEAKCESLTRKIKMYETNHAFMTSHVKTTISDCLKSILSKMECATNDFGDETKEPDSDQKKRRSKCRKTWSNITIPLTLFNYNNDQRHSASDSECVQPGNDEIPQKMSECLELNAQNGRTHETKRHANGENRQTANLEQVTKSHESSELINSTLYRSDYKLNNGNRAEEPNPNNFSVHYRNGQSNLKNSNRGHTKTHESYLPVKENYASECDNIVPITPNRHSRNASLSSVDFNKNNGNFNSTFASQHFHQAQQSPKHSKNSSATQTISSISEKKKQRGCSFYVKVEDSSKYNGHTVEPKTLNDIPLSPNKVHSKNSKPSVAAHTEVPYSFCKNPKFQADHKRQTNFCEDCRGSQNVGFPYA